MASPTFTFKTRLPSTAAAVLCSPKTPFLLEIVYRWMYNKTEKSCLEMVQEKQLALTGNSDGWKWDEFERAVMRWAKPIYWESYAIGLWCNQLRDLEIEYDFNTFNDIIAKDNKPYATVVYDK